MVQKKKGFQTFLKRLKTLLIISMQIMVSKTAVKNRFNPFLAIHSSSLIFN